MTVCLIPIHLDALLLNTDLLVSETTADFSQLPYLDRTLKQEINFDTANISEEIVSQPFQSQNLNLRAGIHLHWALPDGLTRGLQTETGTKFPPVPNRWLVTRKREEKIEAQWVVESDYLYPVESGVPYSVGKGASSGAVTYYYRDESDNNAPFRYMGRKMPLSAYLQDKTPENSFLPEKQPLTAVGYGEATFAAFYPNCHSVFGFHDDAYSGEVKDLTYEVVGWYSRQDDLINFICAQWPRVSSSEIIDKDELLEVLQEEFQWSLPSITVQRSEFERFGNYDKLWQHLIDQGWLKQPNADAAVITPKYKRTNPKLNGDFQASEQDINDFLSSKIANQISERFLCYAQLTFEEQMGDRQVSLNDEKLTAKIAIGNTTMEALSTLISHELRDGLDLDIKEQRIFEDQLESFHLTSAVDNHEIDIGAKFEAARHENGFTAISAGTLWRIKATNEPTPQGGANRSQSLQSANAQDVKPAIDLPRSIADQLTEVNRLQKACDRTHQEIEADRRQLFADWYKYMLSTYHPEDANRGDDYPNVDEVRFFIEQKDIKPLEQKIELARQLNQQRDQALGYLDNQLAEFNQNLKQNHTDEDQSAPSYQREPTPAPRYWQPAEPVILMEGVEFIARAESK